MHFISVVTESVSTTTTTNTESVSTTITPVITVASEDPLAVLSPEEREFFDLLPPSEQEIILASLTSPRPDTEQQEDSSNEALDTLRELLNLNFTTGPAISPRNSEDNDLGKSSESDTTTPAFIAESPSLHNSSSITR